MTSKVENFCELADIAVVLRVRNELIQRYQKYRQERENNEKVNIEKICYTFCDNYNIRIIDLGFDCGPEYAGSFIIDFDDSQDIKMYGSCMIVDGNVFEFYSHNRELSEILIFYNANPLGKICAVFEHDIPIRWELFAGDSYVGKLCTGDYLLFGKWLWSSKSIVKSYMNLQTDSYEFLPVRIDRRDDTLCDFSMMILKLVTLYGLWKPKWLKNDDYVLPNKAIELSQNFQLLYFATNLCFRGIIFDNIFSSRSGP